MINTFRYPNTKSIVFSTEDTIFNPLYHTIKGKAAFQCMEYGSLSPRFNLWDSGRCCGSSIDVDEIILWLDD